LIPQNYPEYPKEYTREDEDKAFYKRMQYDKLPNPLEAPDSIAKIIKKAVSNLTKDIKVQLTLKRT